MGSAARFVRVKVTAADVVKPMIALLMLNIVILSIWTTIDPLERETVVVLQDQYGRDQETYNTCNSDHESIFVAILFMINLGSLLFGLFQAYKARNISTEYQESSYIFLAMSFIGIVSFIAVPIMVISRAHVAALYFATVGLIFVVCASVLSLIFLPKVWALRERNRSTKSEPEASSHSGGVSEQEASSHSGGIKIIGTVMSQFDLEAEIGDVRQEARDNQTLLENEICELENEVHELRLLLSKEKRDQGNGENISDENEVSSEADTEKTASSSSDVGEF